VLLRVQVIDIQTGEALAPGSRGELCIKSPSMMLGYANNPEATAATIDSEGWLHTGNSITRASFIDSQAVVTCTVHIVGCKGRESEGKIKGEGEKKRKMGCSSEFTGPQRTESMVYVCKTGEESAAINYLYRPAVEKYYNVEGCVVCVVSDIT